MIVGEWQAPGEPAHGLTKGNCFTHSLV